MKPEQLQAIRERVNKATPGAWYWSLSENAFYTLKRPVICVVEDGTLKFSPEDADFITFAREDVPALLDEIERLCGVLRYAKDYLEFWPECFALRTAVDKALSGEPT